MGDKPINQPNKNNCPMSPYPNGMEPSHIIVTFSGIQKKVEDPELPPPPAGRYVVPWSECGLFYKDYGNGNVISVLIQNELVTLQADSGYILASFWNEAEFAGTITMQNYWQSLPEHYYGGQAILEMNLYTSGLPASWDAADLIGVPKIEKYFAEELPTDIASRKLRYASHKDKTNIKVFMV